MPTSNGTQYVYVYVVVQKAGQLKWDWAGHVCLMLEKLWVKLHRTGAFRQLVAAGHEGDGWTNMIDSAKAENRRRGFAKGVRIKGSSLLRQNGLAKKKCNKEN